MYYNETGGQCYNHPSPPVSEIGVLLKQLANMFLAPSSSILNPVPWTLFVLVLLALFSVQTTSYSDNLVLVTTGQKAVRSCKLRFCGLANCSLSDDQITLRVLSLWTLFSTSFAKRLKAPSVSKV